MPVLPSSSFPISPYVRGAANATPSAGGTGMDPFSLATLIGGGFNILGGLLGGHGQAKQDEANRAQQLQLSRAQLGQQLGMYEQDRQDAQGKLGLDASTQNPTRVNWRQNQAILNAIMPNLHNFDVRAPAGLEDYMPQMSGGFRLPEGGFSPETLKYFTDDHMMQGEMDLDRQAGVATGGRYTAPSYGAIYQNPRASAMQDHVAKASAGLRQLEDQAQARRQTALVNSLRPQQRRG